VKLHEHIERVGKVFYERREARVGEKAGWQTKTLGDVCDFEGGSQPPKSEFIYDEKLGYVRFLQIRDFGSDKNLTYIRHSKKNRLCNENDILIGRYGASVGKILTNKAGAYNVALMKTIPNLEILDQSWFYHFLISDEFQKPLLNVADRSAQAGFSKDDIYNFPVPVPPLAEQQRIVGLLDEAFESLAVAIANAEKNIQNARALFESHLHVEYAEKAMLGDLVDIKTGKLDANAAVESGRFPFFTCSRDIFAIDIYAFDCEAILLAGNNAVGDFNVKHYNGKFNAYQRTYVITVNEKKRVLYRFLYFQMLKSLKKFKAQSVGAGTKFLKLGMIKELEIELPNLDEQQHIVSTMDVLSEETQRLAAIYSRKLALLAALKKSLLHRAFAGEL
jgi:type I restriction enzyme S subunit